MTGDTLDDFFSSPERDLPREAIVLRPSPWAAFDAAIRFLLQFGLPLLVPILFYALVILPLVPNPPRLGVFTGSGPSPRNPLFWLLESGADLSFGLLALAVPVVRLFFTRYSIGPDDVRVRHQVLEKHEQRIDLQKITALRYRRTLLDKAFGLERLEIVSYGRRGSVQREGSPLSTTLRLVGLRKGSGVGAMLARKMRETASVSSLFEND